jgi:pimeloyl-ACP methyl ester carboxylesterase
VSSVFYLCSMRKVTFKKIRPWIIGILVIYFIGGATLYFLQDKIMFRAEKLPADHKFSFPLPFKEINLAVTADKNLSVIQFTVPDSLCKGVVLYFHGNKKNIERYAPYASIFTRHNYEVWMMDYPGYGKSTGERTEEILYKDALTLYKMARGRFSKDSIILYGKSLGTGIASQLASVRNAKRLILETPYYDFPNMLPSIPPGGWHDTNFLLMNTCLR